MWSEAELALAYELRQEGCEWKFIAQGLGGDPRKLAMAVRHRKDYGLPVQRQLITDEVLHRAYTLRTGSQLGWETISEILGVQRRSLCSAYCRRVPALAPKWSRQKPHGVIELRGIAFSRSDWQKHCEHKHQQSRVVTVRKHLVPVGGDLHGQGG